MLGAILGDIIGSRFEFDRGGKTKDFRLFTNEDSFTDDTVMSIAVADGTMKAIENKLLNESDYKKCLIDSLKYWGRKYPDAGYGVQFYWWLKEEKPKSYGSFGNGSAMRVSSIGWLFDSLQETRQYAKWSAEISHNHLEGIKGAECTAAVIYMARKAKKKEDIKEYVMKEFGYEFKETLEEMRSRHEHIETCMDSLPKALRSFFDGNSYEEIVRNAVSLGGDTDTIAAIAGAMGEAMYGIPDEIRNKGFDYITTSMIKVINQFENCRK